MSMPTPQLSVAVAPADWPVRHSSWVIYSCPRLVKNFRSTVPHAEVHVSSSPYADCASLIFSGPRRA
jgi:hypothetical protein